MLYATSESGPRIRATKGAKGICDECNSPMIPKCGSIVTPHWAHKSRVECDNWTEPETEWHREWKLHFKPEEIEVTIKRDGLHHRADIHLSQPAPDGIDTIEFQHSSIGHDEICCREQFYGTRNLLWILDVQDAYSDGRFEFDPLGRCHQNKPLFRSDWKHGRKSFLECDARIALDLGSRWYDSPHQLFHVFDIGTYRHESYSDWGIRVNDRMYVTGYFQTKSEFISFYTSPIN